MRFLQWLDAGFRSTMGCANHVVTSVLHSNAIRVTVCPAGYQGCVYPTRVLQGFTAAMPTTMHS